MAMEFHELKIAGIVQETADARSFFFDVPRHLRRQFEYKAGQFLTFQLVWNGLTIRRSYSLASSPESDPWPKVTVKRVKDGRASNWFHDTLKVGDPIQVLAPEGRFVLKPVENERPLTLFGGGSGITPVLSILKTALLTTRRDVFLVYANRDQDSIIFRDELDLLLRIFPKRFRVYHHLDAEKGFLAVDQVKALVAPRMTSDFYVCGPAAFMDTVEAGLEALGVSPSDRFFERFTSPVDPDRREPSTEPAAPVGEVPESFQLTLDGKAYTVPYRKGLTLLRAALDAGVTPPSSCEDGYCGCCMAFKRSGEVFMGQHEALTPADIKKGWVLPCQAKAASAAPLAIDFDQKY